MEAGFWHQMWQKGRVGFHQSEINAFLQRHWQHLTLSGQEGVLVPLCGKSLDMLWLQQLGHSILGVELSQKALDEFLQENHLEAGKLLSQEHFCGYQLENMSLYCGDFFHLTKQDCGDVGAVYDRAALVALPPEMRLSYVRHLKEILPAGVKILLIVMEFEGSDLTGPPFSVTEDEVYQLYGNDFHIHLVERFDSSRKGNDLVEKVFVLSALK